MPRTLLVVSAHAADFVWRAAGAIAGVVEHGLFLGLASTVILGMAKGAEIKHL